MAGAVVVVVVVAGVDEARWPPWTPRDIELDGFDMVVGRVGWSKDPLSDVFFDLSRFAALEVRLWNTEQSCCPFRGRNSYSETATMQTTRPERV